MQAADINTPGYKADIPFVQVDLNQRDFAASVGERAFGLVTALEVLGTNVEGPITFLHNVGSLLKAGGIAILTTPNVDSAPGTGQVPADGQDSDDGRDQRADARLRKSFGSFIFHGPDCAWWIISCIRRTAQLTRARYAWAARAFGWSSPETA
jgi:2-polyprenyl-3-methyl-5-hydroxy-6-metoxy-1,4-benzoquinol methylase